ncbi:uncharacterized protein LOC135171756 [Diachasmimorpha longicaudata]|uniref:uncharacterized protein LOC135171756 n=1 Tax=Diachasmimorpha longicaudata TaxID=58733 RepID=UPI0030B91B42
MADDREYEPTQPIEINVGINPVPPIVVNPPQTQAPTTQEHEDWATAVETFPSVNISTIKTRKSEIATMPSTSSTPTQLSTGTNNQLEFLQDRILEFNAIDEELRELRASDTTLEELNGHEEYLKDAWIEFAERSQALIANLPPDHSWMTGKAFLRTGELKRQTLKRIWKLKGEISTKEKLSAGRTTTSQLKRIDLPTFQGKFSQWKEFSDLFQNLVGRKPDMSPAEKLVRLKEALKGPPAELISSFTATDINYEKAWDKLQRHYENPRLIAGHLFNRVLNLRPMAKGDDEAMITNAHIARETVDHLISTAGIPKEDLGDQFVFHLLKRSMEADTRTTWEQRLGTSTNYIPLQELVNFLESTARGMTPDDQHEPTVHQRPKEKIQRGKSPPRARVYHAAEATVQRKEPQHIKPADCCGYCNAKHFIGKCPSFLSLSAQRKLEHLSTTRLCYNCFGTHLVTRCKCTKSCMKCQHRHHTLLHMDPTDRERPPTSTINSGPEQQSTREESGRPTSTQSTRSNEDSTDSTANKRIYAPLSQVEESTQRKSVNAEDAKFSHKSTDQRLVLLATAKARAFSKSGFYTIARILIDQGSELSFISESLVHQLQLQRRHSTIELIGIGGKHACSTRGIVAITLQSTKQPFQQVEINAHILQKVTSRLPTFSCSSASIGSLQQLQLADENYSTPGPINIIIGADNYGKIIGNGIEKSNDDQLVGQLTTFGWTISGPLCNTKYSTRTSLSAARGSSNEQLTELLQRFWVQEEPPISTNPTNELTPEELECEEHFQRTHQRDTSGRYIVRLPLRTSTAALGESRNKALRQLQSVKRRLNANPDYSKLYYDFINEYEALDHMRRIQQVSEPATNYYLPHHGVLREDSLTTKLRVVFNGSNKTSTGISLNDILHAGGKLQVDAMDVLTWLRRHRLVFGTDIVKMFRQINVHPDDWNLQRILWIDENQQLVTYQLTTVTYGQKCSPWLSLRVLQQLVNDEGQRFPAAVLTLTKGRYVDDIYGGADSEGEFKEMIIQLQQICQAGGFPLQKWTSNRPEILQQLNLSTGPAGTVQFEEAVTKTLGLCWHLATDLFQYKSRTFNSTRFTKRVLLSEIAQIFDPLGFIAPVIVRGKILIQELWLLKLAWDDQLPLGYVRRWKEFREELTQLNQLSIPRWLNLSPTIINVQIHGFADASTAAMGAVVYLRVQRDNEPPTISLVCAKTRVAPLKKLTIPRLELTAALLLTKIVSWAQRTLEINGETYLWSDSSVALAWINSHPSRWKEFVHNRVTKIQEELPTAVWRHVGGIYNPADCASRGISPSQLNEHHLWWKGPDWLAKPSSDWPQNTTSAPTEVSLEERPATAHPVAAEARQHPLTEFLNRYSTLSKVLQVTATMNRAIQRLRRQPTPDSSILTTIELNEARTFWVKVTQHQYFESVFQNLNRDIQLPRQHPLAKLTPRIDDQGILRLGGRLKNSLLDPDETHPIILPRQSRLTTLIINEAHQKTLHGGVQLTMAHIRQRYWIVGGRKSVHASILRCAICTRFRATRAQQLMGQLPTSRATPSRPFLHTGVDYAGPFPILKWRPTNAHPSSVHIAVFVCFTTSAVHLELVNRQTTDAFIAAYKRFTGRRGIPAIMYSDNATTFEGAANELNRLYNQESPDNQQIRAALASNGTQWKFIPPNAPHFGGKWEAAVKSTKYHLRRVLGTTTLTYEELNTILIQIEACLNSRPIVPMRDDPDDLQALTPGHFLIGEPLQLLPEPSQLNTNINKITRWNLVTQKIQQFWSRWSRECLQRYHSIYKWNQQQRNIKVGDMVLMINDDLPPARWPLARVIAVRPGADGLVRVAELLTATPEVPTNPDGSPSTQNIRVQRHQYTRLIAKLCLLPTDPTPADQQDDN